MLAVMSGMQSPSGSTDDHDLQVDLNVDADLVRAELQAIGRHHFAPAPAPKPANGSHLAARSNLPLPSTPSFQDSNNRQLLNTLLSRTLGHHDDSSVISGSQVPLMRSAVSPPPTPTPFSSTPQRSAQFLEQATPAVAFVHTTHSPFTMPDGSVAPPSPNPSMTSFAYPPVSLYPSPIPTPSAPSPQPSAPLAAPKRKRAGAAEPVPASNGAKKGKAAATPAAAPNKRAKAAPKAAPAKPAARGRGGKKAKGRGSSEDDSQDDSDSGDDDEDDDEGDSEPGVAGDDKSRKRKRHNQVETRRRQRMRSQIESLGRLVGSHSFKQGTVLINAIAKMKSLEDKVSALNTQLDLKQQTRELAIANQKRQSLLEAAAQKRLRFAETVNRLYTGSFIFGPGSLNHGHAFMHSAVAMELVSLDGKIIDCNEAYASLHERARDELIGSTIFSATHPDHLPATFQMFNRLITPAPASSVPAITAPEDTPSSPSDTALTVPGNEVASAMILAVVPSSGASCLDKQIVTGSGAAVSVRVFSWSVRDASSAPSGAPSRPQYLRGIIVPLNPSPASSSSAAPSSAPVRRPSGDASAASAPRSVITGGRSAAAAASAAITIEEA